MKEFFITELHLLGAFGVSIWSLIANSPQSFVMALTALGIAIARALREYYSFRAEQVEESA